ncbi:hydroxysqualene dehydroxylase HpnE [Schlesneria sp. DSM 10557]|uniref:hydroxysqualene dehydroxylase HpnE n=1 Tax=Schlesneria sp. DSM 10557 TaxID=3044399 RepID=UPI00359F18DB
MSPRIVIVGGGLAGLAAAVALTERNLPCLVLESRIRLGGRASSFHDPTTGSEIDNCQHVTLGCCTNFRHFCEATGLASSFRREPALHFVGPSGKVDRFAAGPLPAPLHLLGGFASLSYLSWQEKQALARGLKALARPVSSADEALPFSEWLKQHRQPTNVVNRFWFVVLVSALSESLDRISVTHARKVIVDAFLANRDGWYVDIPTVPLETLYGGLLVEWLTSRGSQIRLQTGVEKFEMAGEIVSGVRLNSGEIVEGDEFLAAVPFHRIRSLLPDALTSHPDLQGIEQLEPAPISSLHLWFDRPITDLPHAVLVDRLCQWVFNRTLLGNTPASTLLAGPQGTDVVEKSFYYQIVISASHQLGGRSKEDIQQEVLKELAEVWPETANAILLHSRQVTEHRAVFSPVPGIDGLRPAQQSPVANLQLAGDWTRTGWPATMEGAVRSGYLAAENILSRLGKPKRVIRPNLKTAFLSRVIYGLPANEPG